MNRSTSSPTVSPLIEQRLTDETKKCSPTVVKFLVSRRLKRTHPRSADEGEVRKQVFELARLLKSVMPDANDDDLKAIAHAWSRLASSLLGGVDVNLDWEVLRNGIEYAKRKYGDVWDRLVAKAKAMETPGGWDPEPGTLVNLCHCLAEHYGPDKSFPLPVECVAEALDVSVGKAWALRKELVDFGVITLAVKYIKHVRANEYVLGGDAMGTAEASRMAP